MQAYEDFAQAIVDIFAVISNTLQPLGIPFGPFAWFYIIGFTPMLLIIIYLVFRLRKGGGGSMPDGVSKIIASTGDVSAGIAGTRKVKFIKNPGDALVFLKIEENAIQQALTAVDYYGQQGQLDESIKSKLTGLYSDRLETVRAAIAKNESLRDIVETDSAIDKARSDYLRKMAAMSGTTVEAETSESGPPSVGTPGTVETAPATAPSAGPPSEVPSGPLAGPPSGGPPAGGPPSGGPPSGAAPSGGPPSGATPAAAAPSVAEPSTGPPGGAPEGPSAGPPGGAAPSAGPPGGPPGGAPSSPPGEAPSGAPSGKSTLQSEMLAEMERLRALMSGE